MKKVIIGIAVVGMLYLCYGDVFSNQKMVYVDALFCKNVSVEYKISRLNNFLVENPSLKLEVVEMSKKYTNSDKIIKGLK